MFITVSGLVVMVRLVGGTSPHEGRVELRLYNQCGTICLLPAIMVRLVGGTSPHEGRVELRLYNQWGTICLLQHQDQ